MPTYIQRNKIEIILNYSKISICAYENKYKVKQVHTD